MKKAKRLVSLCLALALMGAFLLVPTAAVSLSDIDGSWAKDVITYGVEKGYISGYTDGTFRPNDPVTRAQFAKMLNNALGVKNSEPSQFLDVLTGQWYYDEVCKAVSVQYVSGYTDGTFRPNATITRQEAAAMMSRVVTAPTAAKSSADFADAAKIDSWAKSSIDFIYSKGYMKGDTQNCFDPQGKLTRAQAAQMIYSVVTGETIVADANAPITIDRENILFVNNATASATNAVTLKNCRVLGTLSIGSTDVTLDGTQANAMSVVGEDVTVTASGATLVKKTDLRAGATIQEKNLTGDGFKDVSLTGDLSTATVRLSGSFDTVSVETGTVLSHTNGKIAKMEVAKKANVTFQRGTVDKLEVKADAADTAMILSGDVNVSEATVNAATSFLGEGKIGVATVNAAGCTFQTEPGQLKNNSGDRTDDAVNLTPAVVPANGSQNVATDTTITLVFPENIYAASNQALSLQYLRSNVLTVRQGGSNGTAIEYTATVSGRTVTVTPTAPLAENSAYYVTVAANSLKNAAGKQNTAFSAYFTTASSVAGSMSPTIKPANAETEVSIGADITLAFESVLFNARGETLTPAYIESSAVELRQGSASGNLVDFTAAISADRKTITLKPDANLTLNSTYYVLLKTRTLRNLNSVYNDAITTYFTTGEQKTLQPTSVYPSDGAINISSAVTISLNFTESVYASVGVIATPEYVRDVAVTLREGSATGTPVSCTATFASPYRSISLRPNVALKSNTTYYVVVNAGTLVTADGAANSGYTTRFSTGKDIESDVVITPENDSVNVSVSGPFTITFPAAVVRPGSTTLKDSYAASTAITLRPYSQYGQAVPIRAEVSADSKTITIYPQSELSHSTRYYLTVEKDTLTYTDKTYVGTVTSSFTTIANNPVKIEYSDVSSTSATVTVSSEETCTMTISYRSGSVSKTLRSNLQFNKGDAPKVFNLTDLSAGNYTYVTVTATVNGTQYTNTAQFQMTAASTSTQIDELTLTAGGENYAILTTGNRQYSIPTTYISAATGATLRIKPLEDTVGAVSYVIGPSISSAPYTDLVKGADGYYTLTGLDFTAGTTTTIYLRVLAENGINSQQYTVQIVAN